MVNPNGESDPLRELMVDGAEIDRRAITSALKGRVGIDSGSGRLVLLSGFNELDARRKLLALLLAQKAALLLEVAETETLTNGAATKASGLASGTVAPSLRSLKELRLVEQDAARAYYVADVQVGSAISFINGGLP